MQLPVEDVLVVHPNAGRRAALASALPSCRVVAVGSKREATLQLADATPALIIAPPDEARLFLREVDRSAPEAMRVFMCSQSDPAGLEELMQTAAEGYVFSILDETLAGPELGQTLTHLLQHRGSAIISLPPSYITRFTLGGKEYTARCVEVGNFGATLHLPIEAPLMAFVPGTALKDVRIERDGRFVMKAAWAYVQRAQPMRGAEVMPYLRLGLAWNLAMYQPPQVPSVTLDEPSEVLATLRKALRRETTFWLQPEGETSMQIRLDDPVLDVVDELAVLRGVSSAPPGILGDVVNLSFEMGGQSYNGVGSLLDFSPDGKTLVRVPRGLTIRNWRRLPRFKPGPQNRFLISFQAPVTSQFTTRAVLDLSVGGLSFPFDASSEILPAGLQLDAALLLPDGSRVPCPLEVRSIHALTSYGRSDGGSRPFRAGASFISLPASAREAILTAFISTRCPSAQDGARIPFDGIWGLMDQARYRFHPDYPFDMDRRVFEQIADTHLKL